MTLLDGIINHHLAGELLRPNSWNFNALVSCAKILVWF